MAGNGLVNKSSYHFGYGKKKRTRKGTYAMVLFALALLGTLGIFGYSFRAAGKVSPVVGAAAFAVIGLAAYGIYMGMASFHEMDRNTGISKVAIVLNGLLILFWLFIFVKGF